jgi:hypothetical protein
LKILSGSTDCSSSVLEDELGIALDRSRADEIQLALRDFDERFLRTIPEDKFVYTPKHELEVLLVRTEEDQGYITMLRANSRFGGSAVRGDWTLEYAQRVASHVKISEREAS